MDPYEVLGVTPDTPREEIRAAYRRLAREHHPDLHAGATPEEQDHHQRRMAEVTSAWRLINDPAALARHRGRSSRPGAAPGSGTPARSGAGDRPAGFDYRQAAPSEFDVPASGTWDRTPPVPPRSDPRPAGRRARPRRQPRTRRPRGGRSSRRWTALLAAVLVAIVIGAVLLGFTDVAAAAVL